MSEREQPVPQSYRRRLRREGSMLAVCGLLAAGAVLAAGPGATSHALSTTVQLVVLAAGLAFFGPRAVRKALLAASEAPPTLARDGEPTPLWQLPPLVAILTGAGGFLLGWDAALRVALGCVLVGATQAVLLERIVARWEAGTGRFYVRLPGSSILGTRLEGHRSPQ